MQWRRRHYIMVFRLYWKQAGDRQNMIIRQLNIKNSGEIHDKTLEFSPGINVLYGENESERAIVHTYIKNMYLGDISEAIYDNAVFAAKLKSPTEQDLARELQKFMTGYQGTADSSMDLGRAMQMLKMSRKGYLVQADRKQKETEQERQKLLTRMDDIISDLNNLNGKLDQINEKEESLRMHPGDENGAVILDERMAQAKAKRNSFAMGMLISAVAGIFGLILTAIIADSVSVSLIVAVIAAALVGFCGKQQLKYAREFQKRIRMKKRWVSRQEKLRCSKENLRQDYDEKETELCNLKEEYREYEENSFLLTSEEREVQALNMAMETIERMSGNIHLQVGRKLQMRTSQILSEITDGEYQDVQMDAASHMTVTTGNGVEALECLSRGTLELIYFAMRMAAGELLCQEESLPVILDDIFGMYEEEDLEAVLGWMYKEKKQVIISTCSKREMELLDREGIPYGRQIIS